MKKPRTNFDLSAFSEHLTFHGLTPPTVAIYEIRVRSILASLSLESAREDYLSIPGRVSESALREVLGQYSVSSRTQALCAWRAFVDFLGMDLPKLDQKTPRTRNSPPVGELHPRAVAVWALFRAHPTLDPMLVVALKWRHLRWKGPPEPSKAFGVEILDEGHTFAYPPPLTAFSALWDWARGCYEIANPEQPLIVQDCEGWEPISGDTLLSIHRAGKAGRIPRLVTEVAGATQVRPPMPPPPPFGGGNVKEQKKTR